MEMSRIIGSAFLACLLAGGGTAIAGEGRPGADPARSEMHPREAAAEGRRTHPRVSADLWPLDPVAGHRARPSALDAREAAGEPIRVDIQLARADPALIERIGRHATHVLHVSERHRRVTLEVDDRARLLEIADLDGVDAVERNWEPVRWTGSVTSRAPRALNVEPIANMGPMLDGMNRKLGILSDSFARTDAIRTDDTEPERCPDTANGPVILTGLKNQDSGDLPASIEIFNDSARAASCPDAAGLTDEGAAMAELAYDIAPGIDIAFHTAFISRASFADGFEILCRPAAEGGAGATVVVDDVLFLDEPMYQPGLVARAATDCVDAGVPVFSAAGNSAGNALRQTYSDVDPANAGGFADGFHDWGDGSGFLPLDVDEGETFRVVLQWNQPWTSLKPAGTDRGPQIDLDLYVFDQAEAAVGNILAFSERDQRADEPDAGLDPWEIIEFTAPADGTYYLAVNHFAGSKTTIPQHDSTDLELRLVFFGFDAGTIGGVESPPGPGGPSVYGHAAADGVIAVGAVPWWTVPPEFDPEANDSPTNFIDPQPFSAVGGELPVTFTGDGRFVGRTLALRPQISAVDASNNTFFGFDAAGFTEQDGEPDGIPNFFGTSAAAPNAAAVALLLDQFAGGLSPRAVERALADTARDVTGERAAVGPDPVSGAGLIDAEAMLERFPIAAAGRDREIIRDEEFVLDATGSSGGERDLVDFAWQQTGGPEVELVDADTATARFVAAVNEGRTLTFRVRVEDEDGEEDFDQVRLTVVGALDDEPDDDKSSLPTTFGSGCFIATAAYGTPLAPELEHLRTLRDHYLRATATGTALVTLYYNLSPPAADWLRQRPHARSAARAALVPVVAVAAKPLETSVLILLLVGSLIVVRRGLSPGRQAREERNEKNISRRGAGHAGRSTMH